MKSETKREFRQNVIMWVSTAVLATLAWLGVRALQTEPTPIAKPLPSQKAPTS